MNIYSQILMEAYEQFLLSLGGKKVPTPYRENDLNALQKAGPEFQGKSSPEVLIKTTQKLAREQDFNLNKASIEEIRAFMRKNKLGIDCSGFAYRLLNHLVQKSKGKPLTELGFEHIGRTNVRKLTSDEMSIPIDFKKAQPGDLIRLTLKTDINVLHTVIILENSNSIITYAQSSEQTTPDGVHTVQIKNGKLPKDLDSFEINKKNGDGFRRLKILS